MQQVVLDGHSSLLMDVADDYRQYVENAIQAGQEAQSVDAALDIFYEALAQAYAADRIYKTVKDSPSNAATQEEHARAKRVQHDTDETFVRLSCVFIEEILDFDGQVWASAKNNIAIRRRDEGEEGARKEVAKLVDRFLAYPKILESELLADDSVILASSWLGGSVQR